MCVILFRSPQFCDLVVRTFDRHARRNINFDDFIQACVMLKTLTDKFRAKDLQQNGTIRISYEEVKKESDRKCPLLKSSAANNCLALLTNKV